MVEVTTVDDDDEDDGGDDDIDDFLFASTIVEAGDSSLNALRELLVATIIYCTVVTYRAVQYSSNREQKGSYAER